MCWCGRRWGEGEVEGGMCGWRKGEGEEGEEGEWCMSEQYRPAPRDWNQHQRKT